MASCGQIMQPALLQCRATGLRAHRMPAVLCRAQKGFGKATKPKQVDDTYAPRPGRVKRVRQRNSSNPIPQRGLANVQLPEQEDPQEAAKRAAEEKEFQQRLELLKFEAQQKKAAQGNAAGASGGAPSPQGAVFDAPAQMEDIYANPPSIVDTFTDRLQSDISDPALRKAKIGPGSAGLAIGAVVFGLAFVLVSGGDFATTNRYKGLRPSRAPPTEQEYRQLANRAESLEEQYASNPSDTAALEALAVTYARLQEYGRASDLLDKLVAARPDYLEAWRLLGEATLLQVQPVRSVAAYEKAFELDGNNIQVLTGLTDAYIANSQQSKAVTMLTKLRSGLGSSSSSSSSATEAGTAEGGSSSATSSSSSRVVDPVALQLLLGKTYAAWRGHDQDALSSYEALIKAAPEDFRGYLAKGVFLKERGRKGDAERMFLQAKFYAPDNMQAFVASRAGENPVLDLPDNGME